LGPGLARLANGPPSTDHDVGSELDRDTRVFPRRGTSRGIGRCGTWRRGDDRSALGDRVCSSHRALPNSFDDRLRLGRRLGLELAGQSLREFLIGVNRAGSIAESVEQREEISNDAFIQSGQLDRAARADNRRGVALLPLASFGDLSRGASSRRTETRSLAFDPSSKPPESSAKKPGSKSPRYRSRASPYRFELEVIAERSGVAPECS